MKYCYSAIFALVAILGTIATGIQHQSRAQRVLLLSKIVSQHEKTLSEVAREEELLCPVPMPRGSVIAVAWKETKFDPTAVNPEKASKCYRNAKTNAERERCKSTGIMQTAIRYFGHSDDPYMQIRIGVRKKLCPSWVKHQSLRLAYRDWNGIGAQAERYADEAMKDFEFWRRRA